MLALFVHVAARDKKEAANKNTAAKCAGPLLDKERVMFFWARI
jgi:hypothetical protein